MRKLLAVLLVTIGVSAVPAPAAVVSCPGNRPLGTTGMWYGDLSVRNLSCRRARQALRSARYGGSMRVRGWSCSLIGTYGDGGIFRCTRAAKAMRFSAGG